MLKKLIPRQSIPVELIQAKAYELWATRERNKQSGTSEDDWSKAIELLNQDWWFVTSWKIDKRYQQLKVSAATSIKNAISFKTLSQAVNASVLIGAITFIAGEQQRRDAQVYQAWQVISAAHGQPGSGGRVQALEFLNSQPRRIPWFWLHWHKENLSGLEAPKAYLVPSRKDIYKVGGIIDLNEKGGIKLSNANMESANLQGAQLVSANLQEAYLGDAKLQGADLAAANLQKANLFNAKLQRAHLENANLQGANLTIANLQGAYLESANLWGVSLDTAKLQGAHLRSANLQGAYLFNANLQGAHLEDANLQGANLRSANLQGAYLESANMQKATYTDKSTSPETCKHYTEHYLYPCPTLFPLNFDPKEAGMELLK